MKFYAQVTLDKKIVPLETSDQEELSKLKRGTIYQFEVKKKRNTQFHRKFFSLLNLAYQNQNDKDEINNFEDFRAYVTIKAGFHKRIVTEKGELFLPKSINFSSMDEIEFSELYNKVFDFILLFLNTEKEELEQAIIDYI